MQSRAVRFLVHYGLPAVVVLLLMLVVGNMLMFRLEKPRSHRPTWNSQQGPYPGRSAFSEADAPVYFERDAQVAELIRRLHAVDASAADRFVCVAGASGSGKSSLVHAGVIPRRWSVLPVVVPAGEPLCVRFRPRCTGTVRTQPRSGRAFRRLRVRRGRRRADRPRCGYRAGHAAALLFVTRRQAQA
jgi:hypothetical protein